MKNLAIIIFSLPFWGLGGFISAHPMPHSVVVLKVHEKHYSGQIQLPLSELQTAIGLGVNDHSERLIERLGDTLRKYLLKHIRPKSFEGKPWKVVLGDMKVIETKSQLSGDYQELVIDFEMSPPQNYDLRNFYFDYDVILHQVASHKVLIAVKQDWQQGIILGDSTMQQVGVMEWDIRSNTLNPFQISLQVGSNWVGFKNMVSLGVNHISEGTDHLLFLLVLLLPATLTVSEKRWGVFGGIRYSLIRLLKIVTAFTLGHSLTLLLGSMGLVRPPNQIIEILIAFSILISAVHAWKPIFAGREIFMASGFGLIHGLAFADSLQNLELNTNQMIISILGFNIGIEIMQLLIISLTIPWIILLSQTPIYANFRLICAISVATAAIAWMIERITGNVNFATIFIEKIASFAPLILLIFALFSLLSFRRNKQHLT